MTKREKFSRRWNSLLYNHLWLKYIVEYGFNLIMTLFSAITFFIGFCVFLSPTGAHSQIVSGGASGFAQVIRLIFSISGADDEVLQNVWYIAYFLTNLPIMFLAFFGIGKRFGIFTIVNVLSVTLLTHFLQNNQFFHELAYQFAAFDDSGFDSGAMLCRALFAGVFTGISSAIAFKIESSAGGFDVVAYFISLKKGTNTGPYLVIINGIILISSAILTGIGGHDWVLAISSLFYSIIYLFTVTLLVDLINIRNKKAQIEIITKDSKIADKLMAYIPHGATMLTGVGAFSGESRYVIHMVVSTNEVRKTTKIIKELDPNSFVNVSSLQQVYGHFHMRTIK